MAIQGDIVPGTNASDPINRSNTTPGAVVNSDPFITELQNRLISTSGAVSSIDSSIESAINNAIGNVDKSRQSSAQRIESAFGREIGYARESQANNVAESQNRQQGYATNVAALRELVGATDKQINDLESRKQEALLANDSAAYQEYSKLQMEGLKFKQESQQRVFTNLISTANFALNNASLQENKRQFTISQNSQEKQAISRIALEFGIPVREGDTIDSVTSRAAPLASQKQQLELSKMRAEINRANAEAAKALRGDTPSQDSASINAIAEAVLINPASLGLIKDPTTYAKVQLQAQNLTKAQYSTEDGIRQVLKSGNIQDVSTAIQNSLFLSPDEKAKAYKAVADVNLKVTSEATAQKRKETQNKTPVTQKPVGFFARDINS